MFPDTIQINCIDYVKDDNARLRMATYDLESIRQQFKEIGDNRFSMEMLDLLNCTPIGSNELSQNQRVDGYWCELTNFKPWALIVTAYDKELEDEIDCEYINEQLMAKMEKKITNIKSALYAAKAEHKRKILKNAFAPILEQE